MTQVFSVGYLRHNSAINNVEIVFICKGGHLHEFWQAYEWEGGVPEDRLLGIPMRSSHSGVFSLRDPIQLPRKSNDI